MNENINLCEILKDCPKGTIFWSKVHGVVKFQSIENSIYPISVIYNNNGCPCDVRFTKEGFINVYFKGECLLVPSKNQQDWSKFKAPWLKKPKFDPKTLQPFDKVLVRDYSSCYWNCDFFSRIDNSTSNHKFITVSSAYIFCIPYNDETKNLVGTSEEAPEYYRYWED